MAEHEQMLQATLTGDVEQAARVLVAHLQRSLGTVRAVFEARQETDPSGLLNQLK
jgi:DNA-binding GntR family transcriptional regulator